MSPQRVQSTNDQGYGFNYMYGGGQPMNDMGFSGVSYEQGDWGNSFDQGMRR